ncbi:DUF1835 domain-containing protein [Sphingomonas sp. NSE70-1]|uniref:DUF1835 domain-containing protein n=1 Tax=Sphingomonas caseinilyticus TaxID=2908205 RepID=A0ABT0RXK6_9SPHN|nr:DUF3658 domain-containing protein [Sphingomonas caseinilyticus]MCL6699747.1 DUF1835 domain-containing protein [Sphingomonas caseinilyticus]
MLHVLFSSSAAGILRQVFRTRKIRDKVVDLTESLEWGPMGTENFRDRAEWLDHNVPNDFGGWTWIVEHVSDFRAHIASDPDRLVWLAPYSAQERAGFYWYLDQFGGANLKMIIADYPLRDFCRGDLPKSLGLLGNDQMSQLLDECPRTSWNKARFPAENWRSLKADSAMLRVIENGELRSAPSNHFDERLLRRIGSEWKECLRVIGYSLGDIWKTGQDADDVFLLWRLRELIRAGVIACDRDSLTWPLRSERMPMVRRIE